MHQVVPPMLHLSLGIFNKLFDAVEEEVHMLDVQLLRNAANTLDVFGPSIFDR